MSKSLSIEIYGRVQGVFFRASAKQEADKLALYGFVMNRPDGSVFIEVKGSEHELACFVAWCRQGPPSAEVSRIDIKECEAGDFQEFKIVSSI